MLGLLGGIFAAKLSIVHGTDAFCSHSYWPVSIVMLPYILFFLCIWACVSIGKQVSLSLYIEGNVFFLSVFCLSFFRSYTL